MKLSDVSHGPDWIIWAVFIMFVILSIILISGHGSGLIAGYNTASQEEKDKFDAKKMCRLTGVGMAVVAILILIMGLFEDVLPANFAYVAAGIIVAVCLVMIIAINTVCRK
ncbi:DUF3784 domain-containing protein [Sporofaciens sp. SGI.106]|uniref:DUF3784 domain-containing protein n=1 Tax=Sporofaciens sp. SGI.106 TaxID=3420568 RepID=UPI003D04D1CD